MDHRWEKQTHFAEVAEALRLTTMQVVAQTDFKLGTLVIYTPAEDGTGDIWTALLRRNRDGIYKVLERRNMGKSMKDVEKEVRRRTGG